MKVPLLHLKPQVPLDEQVAVPLAGAAAHGVHDRPQVSVLVFGTQAFEHEWNPDEHPHVCAVRSQVWLAPHWLSEAQPGLHWWAVTSQISVLAHWVSKAQPGLHW